MNKKQLLQFHKKKTGHNSRQNTKTTDYTRCIPAKTIKPLYSSEIKLACELFGESRGIPPECLRMSLVCVVYKYLDLNKNFKLLNTIMHVGRCYFIIIMLINLLNTQFIQYKRG